MIPAGKYPGEHGTIVVHTVANGFRFEYIPHTPTKRNSLNDVWKQDAPFTLDQLRSELVRIGVLQNNYLNLSGKDVRGLYRYLESCNAVESLDMVTVYRCFAGSFELHFKGATSLQRIKDYPNTLADQLALLRSDTNAIPDNDITNRSFEI